MTNEELAERIEALEGLLREARKALDEVQGSFAGERYAERVITNIDAALKGGASDGVPNASGDPLVDEIVAKLVAGETESQNVG